MLTFGFGTKSVVLLFFFIQGLIFAFLLLVKGSQNGKSAQWLSFFLFLCCLYIAPFMLGYAGWYGEDGYRELLFYLPFQQLFLIGPVAYFYTRSLADDHYRLRGREWWHLLPGGLYLLYSLFIFVADYFILDQVYFYADGQDKDFDLWYQACGFFSLLIYLGLSIQYYFRYKRNIFEELSYADEVVYRWLLHFLSAMVLLLGLRALFFMINPEWGEFGRKFWYYLCFSIVVYFLSIQGYTHTIRQRSLGYFRYREQAQNRPDRLSEPKEQDLLPTHLEAEKKRLLQLMRQGQLYRNPGLTLADLAAALSLTTKQVSTIVNQGFQMNFNDFVNLHRIYAVLDALQKKEHEQKTLLALAFEYGFNSKSTFNRAFKKQTGRTPNYFIENEVSNRDLKRKW